MFHEIRHAAHSHIGMKILDEEIKKKNKEEKKRKISFKNQTLKIK